MSKSPVISPYLMFGGRCEEAIEFYKTALGAEVEMIMRFDENPDKDKGGEGCPPLPADWEKKIMHASFKVGDNVIMASDGCETVTKFEGFSLSFAVSSEDCANRAFNALADGGKVNMPLMKTFWSPCFGMLTDRFGVDWMVNVVP